MIWFLIAILGVIAAVLIALGVRQLWQKRRIKAEVALSDTHSRPTPYQPTHVFGSGCLLVFGLAWTSFSLVFVVVGLGSVAAEWTTYTLLRDNGVTTEAEVISQRVNEDSDGDTYYITYRYTAPLPQGDRDSFTREESVSQKEYQTLTPGTQVSVRYAASHPETARLVNSSRTAALILPLFFSLFGGVFALVGIGLIAGGAKSMRQARKLAYQGVTSQAHIIERWMDTDSDGDTTYCVSYRFTAPGHPEIIKAEYNRKAYHLPDDTVAVRYVPNEPDICRLEVP
ncbi:MAG: DUF3592 domain-containing protein [Anaerolineae bacterium]|nr:DUF3592 domain-containing protein [Anaerolineae bacterium]